MRTPVTDHPEPVPAAVVTDNARALGWMALSVLSAAALTLAVRGVSLSIDSRMIVLLRSGLTLAALTAAVVAYSPWRRSLRVTVPWLHLQRGLMTGFSIQLGFYTLAHVPLATATVLFFTAPIFATLLAALLQGETVGPRRWGAVAAGFAGALIILRPDTGGVSWPMLAALGSSVLFAGALTLSRGVATADGAFAALYSSVAITVVIAVPLAVPVWQMPSGWVTWGAVGVIVVMGGLRSVGDLQAYRLGEAGLLGPFSYLRIVIIALGSWILFDEVVDGPTWLGASIIVASTLYIAHRERRRKSGMPAS